MQHASESGGSTAKHFTFPTHVTIQNVREVFAALQQLHLGKGESLSIDASATANITTPGIQLLLALDKTLQHNGGALTLVNPQPVFGDALALAGLGKQLATWSNTDA